MNNDTTSGSTLDNDVKAKAKVLRIRSKRNLGKARSPGHALRHPVAPPTQLTNIKFMNRSQREAHRQGVEIWV